MLFNIDLNVFTFIADFICSGILFQIGAQSDCRVSWNDMASIFVGLSGIGIQSVIRNDCLK